MPAKKKKIAIVKSVTRKKRLHKHVIADLSTNYVERWALKSGFTAERVEKDYGYDLNIYTFNAAGEFENGNIYLQLKATGNLRMSDDRKECLIDIIRADLDAWYHEPMPVILVLYDAAAEEAYWIYIQQYFKNLPNFKLRKVKKFKTVRIPVVNRISEGTFGLFRTFKTNTLKQVSRVITYE